VCQHHGSVGGWVDEQDPENPEVTAEYDSNPQSVYDQKEEVCATCSCHVHTLWDVADAPHDV
jgi:hypothetical protein